MQTSKSVTKPSTAWMVNDVVLYNIEIFVTICQIMIWQNAPKKYH